MRLARLVEYRLLFHVPPVSRRFDMRVGERSIEFSPTLARAAASPGEVRDSERERRSQIR
jgi:hypothetical protein